jgi:hypothetical protein
MATRQSRSPGVVALAFLVVTAVVIVLALAVDSRVLGNSARRPNADQIMARVFDVYAHLTSYQDSGTVRTISSDGSGESRRASTFSTAFTRQGTFRYEFLAQDRESDALSEVVWRDGTRLRHWDSRAKEERVPESLLLAVEGAARAPGLRSRFHVLALLLPETRPARSSATPALWRIADASLAAKPCYQLEQTGGDMGNTKFTLWIEKSSHLVLQTEELSTFDMADGPEVSTKIQVVYNPRVNRSVPERALAFRP